MTSVGNALQALARAGRSAHSPAAYAASGGAVAVLGLGGRLEAAGLLGRRDDPLHRALQDDRGHGVLEVHHDPPVVLQVALVQRARAAAVPPGVVQPDPVDRDHVGPAVTAPGAVTRSEDGVGRGAGGLVPAVAGAEPEVVLFRAGYLSEVTGLRLADGRGVVLKARPPAPGWLRRGPGGPGRGRPPPAPGGRSRRLGVAEPPLARRSPAGCP